MAHDKSAAARPKEALAAARRAAKRSRSWVELHNALYGVGGVCTRMFPTPADRTAFAGTVEYRQIADLIAALPDDDAAGDSARPTRSIDEVNGRILVRVPRSVHAALLAEAEAEGVSLNQLILAKVTLQLRAAV